MSTHFESSGNIDEYAWRFRPILMFSPSDKHPDLIKQQATFIESEDGMAERDMVLIKILGDVVATTIEPVCTIAPGVLREKFDVDRSEFRVLLLGKDTSVKHSSESPVSIKTLFSLVDSMPIRLQEIRERGRLR